MHPGNWISVLACVAAIVTGAYELTVASVAATFVALGGLEWTSRATAE